MTLQEELLSDLKVELENEVGFSEDILNVKIKSVIREAKNRRNYSATNYTNDEIEADLTNFYSILLNVSRYDYNMVGAENESAHSENSVSRKMIDREKLWIGLHAFVKVL